MSTELGLRLPGGRWCVHRDYIGHVGTTGTGNIVLRIHRERDRDGSREVAYVVLTPGEAVELSNTLIAGVS